MHPTDQQLQRWMRGELESHAVLRLESHLETCERCATRLDTLPNPDAELIGRLRRSTVVEEQFQIWKETHPSNSSNDSCLEIESQRWRLKRCLGRGGIGEVWLTQDAKLNQVVALKRLRKEVASNRSVQRRFIREAHFTAMLSHPSVPYVLDFNLDGEASYYVMELVEGRTMAQAIQELHRQVERSGVYPMSLLIKRLRELVSVANAIAYAHVKGVIHRDLKSENVVLGEFGQVTVIDWGLAKRVDESDPDLLTQDDPLESVDPPFDSTLTCQGEKLGTPCFMAPEQVLGDKTQIDHRTDVHGLACMLYEILTGKPPFLGESTSEVFAAVIGRAPLPPRHWNADIPEALQNVCLQGLQKNPEDRPQSASEFAGLLESWIVQEATRSQNETAREQFFSLTKDLLVIHDLEGRIQWINPAWEFVLGWKPEEVIGRRPASFTHCDDRGILQRAIKGVRSGESIDGIEVRMQCKEGADRWVSWTASPFPDEDLVYAVGRDVDDRRKREQQYANLLDAAPDALIVIAAEDRNIRLANQEAARLFGYEEPELIGQSIEKLIPARFHDSHPEKVSSYSKNPALRPLEQAKELYGLHHDGHEFRVHIRLSPLQTEDGLLVSAAIRPHTE